MADINNASSAPPAISQAINKIMENPELISMVANALKNSQGASGELSAEKPSDGKGSESTEKVESVFAEGIPPNLGEMVGSLVPLLSGLDASRQRGQQNLEKKEPHSAKCRNDLLCALKPYVSAGRQEAINYIIRITELSDMLKRLN